MFEQAARVTGPSDRDEEHARALELDRDTANATISSLEHEIDEIRAQYPITRWVDADPQWRDASGSRTNTH